MPSIAALSPSSCVVQWITEPLSHGPMHSWSSDVQPPAGGSPLGATASDDGP